MVTKLMLVLIFVMLIVFCITDLKTSLIRNKHLLGFLCIGIVYSISKGIESGEITSVSTFFINGVVPFIVGMLIIGVITFIAFCFGIIGAGDCKLFTVLGGVFGAVFTLDVILWAILLTVPVSLVLYPKEALKMYKHLFINLKLKFYYKLNVPVVDETMNTRKPFALNIALGTLISYLGGSIVCLYF